MTTVANQPVSDDGNAKSGQGVKSSVGNRDTFLGKGIAPGQYQQVSGGTPGPALGSGTGLPKSSAAPLTSIEKTLKDQGV